MGGAPRNRGGDGGQVGGQGSGRGNYGRSPGRPGLMEVASEKLPGRWRPFPLGCAWLRGLLRQKENGKDQAVSPHREGTQGVSELSGVGMSDQNWDSQAGRGSSELVPEHGFGVTEFLSRDGS